MSFYIRKDEMIFESESGTEVKISSYFDDKVVVETWNHDSLVADNECLFTAEELRTLAKLLVAAADDFGGKHVKR